MRRVLFVLAATLFFAFTPIIQATEGMVVVPSAHSVSVTIDKLESALKSKGMTVFTRINHAANAEAADLALRPTEVLIFGNPKIGTPLMNCSQSIAIDLPQKMMAWQDEAGDVLLAYNDPEYLKGRHASEGCDAVFGRVVNALANFAKAATAP